MAEEIVFHSPEKQQTIDRLLAQIHDLEFKIRAREDELERVKRELISLKRVQKSYDPPFEGVSFLR